MNVNMISASPAGVFVERDVELLEQLGHSVLLRRNVQRPRDMIRPLLSRFRPDHADATIFWLGGATTSWWATLPPVLRGPSAVVFGGGEFMDLPETPGVGYSNPQVRNWVYRTLRGFDAAVFVAPHLLHAASRLGLPLPKSIFISPTSVDPMRFADLGKEARTAILVGPVTAPYRLKVKGVDRLLRMAESNPRWTFRLVGISDDVAGLVRPVPKNVITIGRVPAEAVEGPSIASLVGRSEVVLCLSRWEGMPNSLIEGMLCECRPVVADDVPSVVWAVGNTGTVLRAPDFDVNLDDLWGDGRAARERAIRMFSMDQRKRMWTRLLEKLPSIA